jgi:hypothetical protein
MPLISINPNTDKKEGKPMKTLSCCLGAVVLVSAAGALKSIQTPLVQAGAGRPSQTEYVIERIPSSAVHHRQSNAPRLRLWESTSGNWSGYAVPLDGSDSDIFSEVDGTWTVPTLTGAKGRTAYSSVWVGIDGYTDGTVEQIGTEHDWTSKGQQNYVWFEMYPSAAYKITGFPASPGDSISAQVKYVRQGTVQVSRRQSVTGSIFQLTITNNTRNVAYTVPSSYTTVATAARSSAEWIVEAPSSAGGILPLANFGTVNLSGCYAVGSSGELNPITGWTPDPLTMLNPSGATASPSDLLLGGTAFSVSFQ